MFAIPMTLTVQGPGIVRQSPRRHAAGRDITVANCDVSSMAAGSVTEYIGTEWSRVLSAGVAINCVNCSACW